MKLNRCKCMKKIIYFVCILIVAIACQTKEMSDPSQNCKTIYASIDDNSPTKISLSEDGKVLWSEDDMIAVFDKAGYDIYFYDIDEEYVGKNYAEFVLRASSPKDELGALDHNVAVYPYFPYDCMKSETVYGAYELSLGVHGAYHCSTPADLQDEWLMAAVSEDNNYKFKNILGAVKLQLKGTQKIRSLTFSGNGSENVSGSAVVTVYSDGSDPEIMMIGNDEYYSKICEIWFDNVQLNEDVSTDFIIPLPPMDFNDGFTVTVIDEDDKYYALTTDRKQSVRRSEILVMPAVELLDGVSSFPSSLTYYLYEGESIRINEDNLPVSWVSSSPEVAFVDENGNLMAVSDGEAFIDCIVGNREIGVVVVTVYPNPECTTDYIDEYGINHGKGVAFGNVVWAPVNCGYHQTDYKYGKLYQWGRKYGQGYSGTLGPVYDDAGNLLEYEFYSDATYPTISVGPVSMEIGQSIDNSNIHYLIPYNENLTYEQYNWLDHSDNHLLNSGTEENPEKTEYDPCPDGWRVPTESEYSSLDSMCRTRQLIYNDDVLGYLLKGEKSSLEYYPEIFFPLTGSNDLPGDLGLLSMGRDLYGYYMTSTVIYDGLYSTYGSEGSYSAALKMSANPIRCVQE